jgi:hypothetical protein
MEDGGWRSGAWGLIQYEAVGNRGRSFTQVHSTQYSLAPTPYSLLPLPLPTQDTGHRTQYSSVYSKFADEDDMRHSSLRPHPAKPASTRSGTSRIPK